MSSLIASLNILIYRGILTLILKGFKRFFGTTRFLPALTRHLYPAYSVIEEIVEGFLVWGNLISTNFNQSNSVMN